MEKFIFLSFLINYGSALSPTLSELGNPFLSSDVGQLNSKTDSAPAELFFSQKLDHYNSEDKRVWNQRYWTTDEYYKPGGPVFLWINGIRAASAVTIKFESIQYVQYAQKLGAMVFSLEHRFVGNSRPLPDTSTENLAYLNIEQITGDIANFVRGMNTLNNFPPETKWIVFGGSIAGALAAWSRLKYQDLIHGAVVSSATVYVKADFAEYSEFIKKVLASYNERCPQVIMEAHKEMDKYLKTADGRKKLKETFQLCDENQLNTPEDIQNFFNDVAGFIMSVVQYSKDNRESATKDTTVETICDILVKENSSPITQYAEVNALRLKLFPKRGCLGTQLQPWIEDWKLIDYESAGLTERVRIYRDCSQMGFYQTSSSPNELFGAHFPLDFFIKQCELIFGPKFNRKNLEDAVNRVNQNYGGYEFNADRTVFVNGSKDPWSPMSITQAQEGAPFDVIMVEGGAHCVDSYPPRDADSPELKKAREKILELLTKWIADP